jgi:hypothetical protein
VLLAACSGGGGSGASGPDPALSARPTVAVATSSTTVRKPDHKLYSFDPNPVPPPIINIGTNYVAIARSLLDYGEWLVSHDPDPDLVPRIAAPDSTVRRAYVHDLTILRNNHLRGYELYSRSHSVTIVSARADAFSVRVDEFITARRTVSAAGRTLSELRFEGTTTYADVVVKIDRHWYLARNDEMPK